MSAGAPREIGIYMVDVGQGDATVILLPDDRGAVVFDCKDSSTVKKLLTHWEVDKLAAVIVSHLDLDHIAGVGDLLLTWSGSIESVYIAADRALDDPDAHTTAKELARRAVDGEKNKRWALYPSHKHPAPILSGTGWRVRLLAPEYSKTMKRELGHDWDDANEYSAVLRVEMGNGSVIIGGDAPLVTWDAITPADRKTDVFRIPHHGGALNDGGVPTGWDVQRLYEEVSAATAVISVGTNNGHDHPDPAWVKPIMGGACRTLCTQVTKLCEPSAKSDPETWRRDIETATHFAEPPWRHLTDKHQNIIKGRSEVPCAGTIVVQLREDGTVGIKPWSAGAHDQVVDRWSTPACRVAKVAGPGSGTVP